MIIQGSNAPIIIDFNEDLSIVKDMSIVLYNRQKELKHWEFSDLIMNDKQIICELTQEETLNFIPGSASLEIKWMEEDQLIQFCTVVSVTIVERRDSYILGGSNA